MKWSLRVHDRLVQHHFQNLPLAVKAATDVIAILSALQAFHVCTGINDPKFSPVARLRRNFYTKKGMKLNIMYVHMSSNFLCYAGRKVAYYDKPNKTIRHVECALLLDDSSPPCCSQCKHYRFNSLNMQATI